MRARASRSAQGARWRGPQLQGGPHSPNPSPKERGLNIFCEGPPPTASTPASARRAQDPRGCGVERSATASTPWSGTNATRLIREEKESSGTQKISPLSLGEGFGEWGSWAAQRRAGAASGGNRRGGLDRGDALVEFGHQRARDWAGHAGADRLSVDAHDRNDLARRARQERLVGARQIFLEQCFFARAVAERASPIPARRRALRRQAGRRRAEPCAPRRTSPRRSSTGRTRRVRRGDCASALRRSDA